MPKKFQGENSKAVEARARKTARKEEELERKKKAEEDAYWQDDDKNVSRKLQRKDERQKKQQEVFERKQQVKALLEKENEHLSSSAKNHSNNKVTRADILAREEQRINERLKQDEQIKLSVILHLVAAKKISIPDEVITENVNRLLIDGEQARTIDEALIVLDSAPEAVDRHPEKRMKASYLLYEEKNLPRLKIENPNLRLSVRIL